MYAISWLSGILLEEEISNVPSEQKMTGHLKNGVPTMFFWSPSVKRELLFKRYGQVKRELLFKRYGQAKRFLKRWHRYGWHRNRADRYDGVEPQIIKIDLLTYRIR